MNFKDLIPKRIYMPIAFQRRGKNTELSFIYDLSKLKTFWLSLVLLLTCYVSKAQCSYTGTPLTQVGSTYTFCVDNGATYTSGTVNSGQYILVNVVKGFTYSFSVGNVFTANENLTILDASTNGNVSPATFASGASGATISNWVSSLSGQIKVLLSRGNCSNANVTGGAITITLNAVGNTQDSQTAFGTDQWVAHVYNWTGAPAPGGASPASPSTTVAPFTNASYVGYYTIGTESISETFGGDYNCFPVYSNGVVRTNMYTEQYAVRYRMRSTKTGCYSLATTGDDGVRVYVDGVKVYDEWKEQSPTNYANILLYLNGNSDIIFDYYENGGQNVNAFSLTPFDGSSNTIAQSSVTVCSGVSPGALNGSAYAYTGTSTNPTISFQWQSSTDNVTFTNIAGGTTEDYTPPTQTTTTSNVIRYYRRIVTAAAATASGCTYISNVVTVVTSPGVPGTPGVISGNNTQCANVTGQTYSVAAVANTVSYTWTLPVGWIITSGSGTNSITVTTGNNGQNGNITVSAVNGCGTGTARTLAVIVNANNTAGAASSTPTLCVNTALTTITHTTTGATGIGTPTGIPAGVNASWTSNTINISGTPSVSGTFSYNIPLTGGCSSASATGTITVTASQTVSSASSSPTLCVNTALTAITHTTTGATGIGTATGLPAGVTAGWASNTITITGTPTASGTFSYSIPLTGGCGTVNATGTITVNSTSVAPTGITGTTTICNGNSTTLTVAGGSIGTGATAQWFTGSCGGTSAGTGNAITVSPSSNTTYYVRYSGTCNTTTCASQVVTVNTPSVAPTGITGTTTICNGNSTTLTVSGGTVGTGVTVQWFTGSCGGTSAGTGNAITVSPSSNTTYYVRYSGTCNTTTCASQLITVNTPSVAPTGITGTTTICNGNSTTLTVSGGSVGTGATAQWYTVSCGGTVAGTGNSITVSPSSNTTYYVRYSGACNTTTCASQLVTVNMPSIAPTGITGTSTICNGNSTTLTVSGGTAGTGATAQWFTGSCGGTAAGTGNSITVLPSSNTTYYVRYNGSCNTTTCASQLVTVNTPSTAPSGITGTTTICNGNSTTLTVSGGTAGTGATAQWFTGSCGGTSAGTGNSITVSPSSNTTYYVRYNGSCNTTTCASQLVTVNTSTSATTISGSAAICLGSSTNLQVSITGGTSPYSVVYSNGASNVTVNGYASGANIPVTPTASTTYTLVSVTSASGCAGTGNSGSAVVSIDTTTSTNGGVSWSNGLPSAGKSVIFDGATANLSTDLSACSLRLINNAIVNVASGKNVTLNGKITVDPGSTFTLNNTANLIQNSTIANSGNIIVKRNSSALKRLDYTIWSSPVAGQGLYAFSPFTFANRFYVYNTATNLYNNPAVGLNVTNTNSDGVNGVDQNNVLFASGKGYLIRMPWDHPTAPAVWAGSFTGVPNNGDVALVMTTGYNAVGNPYPSRINVHDFINGNANISGPLYFWRKTNDTSSSSYATLTKTAYVANGAAGGDTGTGYFNTGDEANWVINIGQGFIVNATSSTNLTFTNSMRRSSNANQFFKTAQPTADSVSGLYWLNLNTSTGVYSQMAVGYSPEGTLGDDRGIDGRNINTDFYLTSLIGADEYSIQGRPDFVTSDVVPLSYKVATAGTYTITIDHIAGVFGSQLIFIKDNQTSTIHNLLTGAYSFTSAVGTFNNRFEIIYQSQLSNPTFTATDVVIYSQGNDFVVNSGNATMASIKVFDIRGRLLQEKTAINANQAIISNESADQVLLLQITSEDGAVVTKKVIK